MIGPGPGRVKKKIRGLWAGPGTGPGKTRPLTALHMSQRTAAMGIDGGRRRRSEHSSLPQQSLLTRGVNTVFEFVRFAEFEILFVLFFLVAFLIFKDLTSRPEYNDILVKKPGGPDWWPNKL